MKKIAILFMTLLFALSILGLVACIDKPTSSESDIQSSTEQQSSSQLPDVPELFELIFTAGGATGEAPSSLELEEGESVQLPENTFIYEGFLFIGWAFGETIYEVGETFVMPASNVEMVATWEEIPEEPNPTFSASEYEYDKLGGSDLELPLDLDGANIYYVEVDGEFLAGAQYSYDEELKCLTISADFVLGLDFGEHEIEVITDAETEQPVKCVLVIVQSLKTTFDEETSKSIVYGRDMGVTFSVGYNTTTPVKLMMGEMEIDEKYYSYDENSFTLSSDWLCHFSEPTSYALYLSNNDVHKFTVSTNVIFATDYDLVTVHDTTVSNIGHNPLYQYSENVTVVNGPEGMEGKVLKITPNTTEVTYDCNGYITLRRDDWNVTWLQGGFTEGKYYFVQFDYMTEGTSVGEFYYGSAGNPDARFNLLLGAENDGVVRRSSFVFSYDEIYNGLFLWAKFIGGGGVVYVDNFRIATLETVPSLSNTGVYDLVGDYTFNYDNANLAFSATLDGEAVQTEYNAEEKKLIIPAEVAENLSAGVHTFTVETLVGILTCELRIVDNRVAVLTNNSASYYASKQDQVELAGSFTEGLTLTSLKAKDVTYDNGYIGGWDFYHLNESIEYVEYASLVCGLDGTGKLIVSGELIDMFWGATKFVAEVSNGTSLEFTIVNEEVLFNSNYDALTMKGIINGGFSNGSPLSSGLWGGVHSFEAREDGKGNAMFIHATANSADFCAITIRMNSHVWEWYTVQGDADHLFRFTFEYQLTNMAEKDAYVLFIIPKGVAVDTKYFGQYSEVVTAADWQEVRFYLNNDGLVHTFDSGLFTWIPDVTNIKVQLPSYTTDSGTRFMMDEIKVSRVKDILKDLPNYQIMQADEFGFVGDGTAVTSITIDGVEIDYQVTDNKIVISKDALNLLSLGEHFMKVVTQNGVYGKVFAVSDSRVANLTVTDLEVVYNQPSAKLAGEFSENLNIVSIARTGYDTVWDQNGNMNVSYITVEEDGLVLSQTLINKHYRTGSYVVTFDNGKSIQFTLTNNIFYYTDYDEVNVFINIGGNSVICQDREMIDVVEVEDGHALKYTPSNATLGHSVSAINGGGADNIIFTFENRNVNNYNWYDLYYKNGEKMILFFDYDVVTGDKESYFNFMWIDVNNEKHYTKLEGKGHFYIELDAYNLRACGINCPVSSPDLVAGSYMLIDNYGIGVYNDQYLTQHSANVVRGGGAVTLAGNFASDLTVTSVMRYGDNHWDNAKVAGIELGVSAVTLSETGLTFSASVIDNLYGTETFIITLSNGDTVRAKLTSNILHYTDYDLYSIHEESQGNVRSCQDTAMWSIVEVEGNKKIKYVPANATLGHAANGAADNGCMTFSNTSLGNHWWWEFALDTSKTIMIFFDYEVVLGEGKDSYYKFNVIKPDGSHQTYDLSGSGTFQVELDASQVMAFRIYCPSGSNELITDTYMLIDNFGFGYKA